MFLFAIIKFLQFLESRSILLPPHYYIGSLISKFFDVENHKIEHPKSDTCIQLLRLKTLVDFVNCLKLGH
jgi:hypothetical protein